MPRSVVYCQDCLEAMRKMPDNAFDLAVVDPVYGGVTSGGYFQNSAHGVAKVKDYHTAIWSQEKTSQEYFDQLMRISRNQIVWGGNYFCEEIHRNSQCWLIWDKVHPDGVRFADCEMAWTSFDLATRIFRYKWNGMLQENMANKEIRIHPTQKPIPLYEWVYKNYAEQGMKILDTHMGSKSSRIAAYNMGLDYTGYEIDETYFKLGCDRFDRHTAQYSLFVDGSE